MYQPFSFMDMNCLLEEMLASKVYQIKWPLNVYQIEVIATNYHKPHIYSQKNILLDLPQT